MPRLQVFATTDRHYFSFVLASGTRSFPSLVNRKSNLPLKEKNLVPPPQKICSKTCYYRVKLIRRKPNHRIAVFPIIERIEISRTFPLIDILASWKQPITPNDPRNELITQNNVTTTYKKRLEHLYIKLILHYNT